MSSWTATMQLALAERREHRTTRRHAAQLRDLARDAMNQSRSALAAQPMSADDARKAHASLDSLNAAIGALGRELGEP